MKNYIQTVTSYQDTYNILHYENIGKFFFVTSNSRSIFHSGLMTCFWENMICVSNLQFISRYTHMEEALKLSKQKFFISSQNTVHQAKETSGCNKIQRCCLQPFAIRFEKLIIAKKTTLLIIHEQIRFHEKIISWFHHDRLE